MKWCREIILDYISDEGNEARTVKDYVIILNIYLNCEKYKQYVDLVV